MTDISAKPAPDRQPLHPLAIRIMHWTNAVAMIIMIMSGWAIYNDEVIFGWLHFPNWITIGDGPEGALQWHFLAMWILVAQRHRLLDLWAEHRPLPPHAAADTASRDHRRDPRSVLALKLAHDDLTRYNAVQRLLYIGVILVIILQVLSGLVVWKPVQFSELAYLFYSFQGARLVHFLCMVAIVGFLVVHVTLALIVPKTLVAMLDGGPLVPREASTDADPASIRPEADAKETTMSQRPAIPSLFRPKARHRPERAGGEPRAHRRRSIGANFCAAASASGR